MSSWPLLIALFGVWILWAIAALFQREVADARRGNPEGRGGGVSVFPVIPLFPFAAWGAALLMDRVAGPWGTRLVGGAHALFGGVLAVSIVRDRYRLRTRGRDGDDVQARDGEATPSLADTDRHRYPIEGIPVEDLIGALLVAEVTPRLSGSRVLRVEVRHDGCLIIQTGFVAGPLAGCGKHALLRRTGATWEVAEISDWKS